MCRTTSDIRNNLIDEYTQLNLKEMEIELEFRLSILNLPSIKN